jgi:thioredoxin 1
MAEGWRPGTPPLTAADVTATLAGHPVLVVHFWAPWNGVDRLFSPVLDAVRPEFEGRIAFRSADVDDAGLVAFCEACGVVNVPALACFVGGRRVRTVVGSRPAGVLRSELAALLGGAQAPNQALQQTPPPVGLLGWLSSLWRRCG